jgi:rod shape-determining protein MreC
VALSLLTFALTAFVGRVPMALSSSVALPHIALYRAGVALRLTLEAMIERREYRADIARLERLLATREGELRQLEWQLRDLELLLGARRNQSPAALLAAPVIGRSATAVGDTLTLGSGERNGIARQMPVTAPEGLVGIVIDTTGYTSVVRTVLDPQSRVGVTVRGKGGQGVVVGDVGGLLRVDRFIVDKPVTIGDVIESNAVGGLFPRGLPVGVVVEVLPPDPNELRRSFLVAPTVEIATLLEVVVIGPP